MAINRRLFKATIFVAVPLLIGLLALMGCAELGLKKPEKSFFDMTPKEKAIVIAHEYNMAYEDYKDQVVLPNLSEDYKELLTYKKAILVELKPLIVIYGGIIDSDGIPGPELETTILNYLSMLGVRLLD